MKIITIIRNEIKMTLKNKLSLLLIILMPVIMIALMGYALKPLFNFEKEGVEKFPVLYVNKDTGWVGQRFDNLIKNQGKAYFELIPSEMNDYEQQLVQENLDEAIIIPSNLTEKVMNGEKIEMIHLSSGSNAIRDQIVEGFLNSYINSVNEQVILQNVATENNLQNYDALKLHQEVVAQYSNINSIHIYQKTLPVSSYQYFGASMLIFFLLTSSLGLGMGIVKDREEKLYDRIHSYSIKESDYLLGKTLGNAIISLIQAVSVILLSHYLFQVEWGHDYIGMALIVLSVILISSGIAVIFSSFFQTQKTLSTVLIVVFWMLTFISGAFAPIPSFERFGQFIFNKWAFDSITNFMTGQSFVQSLRFILQLIGCGFVMWGIGVITYKRRVSCE